MSLSARVFAVFGTVLAAISFAFWRAGRKARNSIPGKQPSDCLHGQETPKATLSNPPEVFFVPQTDQSEVSAADSGRKSENPRERTSTPEQLPGIWVLESAETVGTPIDTSGALATAAVEIAAADVVPEIKSSESSTATLPASPAEPQTPEIVEAPIPIPSGPSSAPEMISSVATHIHRDQIPASETPSKRAEDSQTTVEKPNRAAGEVAEANQDEHQIDVVDSTRVAAVPAIDADEIVASPEVENSASSVAGRIDSSDNVAANSPVASETEVPEAEVSVPAGYVLPASSADPEAIPCLDERDLPKQLLVSSAGDVRADVQTKIDAARDVSIPSESRESVVPAPATDRTDSFNNTEDDLKGADRREPLPTTAAPSAQGSEPQTPVAGQARPIPAKENGALTRKRGGPQRYEPPVRTPDALTAPREPRAPTDGTRSRALNISVHIRFVGRRNRCQVALLPKRAEGLDEAIKVRGPQGVEEWSASQDEWYADIVPSGMAQILSEGARWESESDSTVSWTLAPRDIYVLASKPESGISAFVSTTRLLLREDHLVLCTREMQNAVLSALTAAGCPAPVSLDEQHGVPKGWALFKNVRLTTALPHDPADGIFNILRPVHDVEIELRGGIRVQNLKWLHGHPPQIRLRGDHDSLEVVIDRQTAACDEEGNYTVRGWDAPGSHRIFCGGERASYELVSPPTAWENFPAFTYKRTAPPPGSLTICGPVVKEANQDTVLLVRTGGTYLLGAVPGQIASAAPPFDLRVPAFLGAADFPVVWAVPTTPLQANKATSTIQLLDHHSPETLKAESRTSAAVQRWASLIMDASNKRLSVEPAADSARQLWTEYKLIARRIKKRRR